MTIEPVGRGVLVPQVKIFVALSANNVVVVGVNVVFHRIDSPEHTAKSTTKTKKTCKNPEFNRSVDKNPPAPVPKLGVQGFPRVGWVNCPVLGGACLPTAGGWWLVAPGPCFPWNVGGGVTQTPFNNNPTYIKQTLTKRNNKHLHAHTPPPPLAQPTPYI